MSLERSSTATDQPLEAVARERILDSLTTDLEAGLVEYQCSNCQECCINPSDSVLEEGGVCLESHVHYAAHGHIRGRIPSRWH